MTLNLNCIATMDFTHRNGFKYTSFQLKDMLMIYCTLQLILWYVAHFISLTSFILQSVYAYELRLSF